MYPILHLRLFGAPIDLHAYSLFAALAAAAGAVFALVMLRRERLGYLRSLLLLAAMATGFFLGARLWNWAVNPGNYAGGLTPFSFRLAGFSLYGGIAGAFAALFAMSFVFRRGLWPLLDAFVLPTAAAFALARVGCFLNGCCGGRLTQGWLGVRFPHESRRICSAHPNTAFLRQCGRGPGPAAVPNAAYGAGTGAAWAGAGALAVFSRECPRRRAVPCIRHMVHGDALGRSLFQGAAVSGIYSSYL